MRYDAAAAMYGTVLWRETIEHWFTLHSLGVARKPCIL